MNLSPLSTQINIFDISANTADPQVPDVHSVNADHPSTGLLWIALIPPKKLWTYGTQIVQSSKIKKYLEVVFHFLVVLE